MWVSPKSTRFRLRRWQKLAGWINWVLNVYPLLRPCLNTLFNKIASKSQREQYLRINNDLRGDFSWALHTLALILPVHLLDSLSWAPTDATTTIYCDACPTGMGFWIPSCNQGYVASPPLEAPKLIFYLEELCVLSALQWACQHGPPQGRIVLYTDNLNSVDIFSSLRCQPAFNWMLKASVTLRLSIKALLRVLHVPGEQNEVADALSRDDFDHARSLSPGIQIGHFVPACESRPLFQPSQFKLGVASL